MMIAPAPRGAEPLPWIAPFTVPAELEASGPPESRGIARDHVRMLVSARTTGAMGHTKFDALPSLLAPGDLLVANDSATLPAALIARRPDGGIVRMHVSSQVAPGRWVVEPRGDARNGERFDLPGGAAATLLASVDAVTRRLWYARVDAHASFVDYLHAHGSPIRYAYSKHDVPLEAYQTVFARAPGSAEMPSAGRPFSRRVLTALRERGIIVRTVTLHCGVASSEAHEPPQPESFEISESTAQAVNAARRRGGRVIAIGTTVVRALESAARAGTVIAAAGLTELVISPNRPPTVVDGMMTGFHEPRASHLAMLAALLKPAALSAAYAAALEHRYFWHEFGDIHLVL